MAFITVVIETDSDFSAAELTNRLDQSTRGKNQTLRSIVNHLNGIAGGNHRAILHTQVTSSAATQTITCDQSAATVAVTTLVMAGVTFSVVTTASTSSQITLGANDTAFATNTAAAINTNSTTSALVVASASSNQVTLTRVFPDNFGGITVNSTGFTIGTASKSGGGGTPDEYDFGHT